MASGAKAELRARRFLERQGLRLVAANVRCRRGELDLLMLHGDTLVVVEVRYRAGGGLLDAASSVTTDKQARIIAATQYWLSGHPRWSEQPIRFDVIADDGQTLRWIQDAFEAV